MSEHVEEYCPLTIIDCPYSAVTECDIKVSVTLIIH